MAKNLFITGKPGSGKTTLIKEVCFPYRDKVGGFYTEEMREGSRRQGFILKTFDGKHGVLAEKGMKSAAKLNKYGVDLNVLENIGVTALREALSGKEIIVIDEIGSMEILSGVFRAALLECLSSPRKVLAAIRYNAQPFTDEVKRMAGTELVFLSRDNFPEVKKKVKDWLARGILP
ncbi:MAG: nucleoside-triphosphatase [Endomicrobiales bacterium]